MKKKLLSLIVALMVIVTGVFSMPLISDAATTEKIFPYSKGECSNKAATAANTNFCSFTAGPYTVSKTSPVTIFSDEDEILDIYDLGNGDALYFIGKMQQITLPTDGLVTLSAKLWQTDYLNDSIKFTLLPSKSLSSEIFGIESMEGQRVQDSIYLKQGTYYLAIWHEMLLSDLIEEEENYEFSTWSTDVFAGYQMNIGSASASAISNKAYSGSAISPNVNLWHSGASLAKGTDYNIQYSNNKYPGKATVTISGKGKFYGTKTLTFKIVPKKASISKVRSSKKKTLKVSWKKDTKATGYQVVVAQNKKFTKGKKSATIKKNKTTSKTFKKLKSKKT